MWRQKLHELRLDRWLRLQFPSLPQSFLQSQLRKRKIRLQSAVDVASPVTATRAHSVLREGSVVAIDARLFQSKFQSRLPTRARAELCEEETQWNETVEKRRDQKRAERLRQCVVYQDAHFVVLNKPQGLAVQVEYGYSDRERQIGIEIEWGRGRDVFLCVWVWVYPCVLTC